MTKPRPVTKRALLYCSAKRRFTWHEYLDSFETIVPFSSVPGEERVGGAGWEHVFRCEETGAQRRWGFEPAKSRAAEILEMEGN